MSWAGHEPFLRAILIQLAERGYGDVSVPDACAEAGVAEAELPGELAETDSALAAAYEYRAKEILATTSARCRSEDAWPERVRAGLTEIAERIAANPEIAVAMLRAFPSIRPSTYASYAELLEGFVPFMREGRQYSDAGDELPGEVELLAVGAAETLIFEEVEGGRAERLPKMVPQILFSVLVPFLGPEAAAEAMQIAAAAI